MKRRVVVTKGGTSLSRKSDLAAIAGGESGIHETAASTPASTASISAVEI
jgi:hypothetical protein